MVSLSVDADESVYNDILVKVKNNVLGSLTFTNGSPVRQAKLINRFQAKAKLPLLIGQETEWTLSTIDSLLNFPSPLLLGAIRNDSLLYALGAEIARQMKLLGLHINFASLHDHQSKTPNQIIDYHTLGENNLRVANKASALVRGMRDNEILTCIKYFTLKGVTITDVQKGWPVISPRIDSIKMYPFQKLIDQDVSGIISASAEVPLLLYQPVNLAKKNNYNATVLSSLFVGDWLKKEMNFKGLSYADVRSTKSIAEKFKEGDAEMFTFQTGNDVLMNPYDISAAIRRIKKLIRKDERYQNQLNTSVRKILAAKFDAGLWKKQVVPTDNLLARLNTIESQLLNQKLLQATATVLQNKNKTLPIRILENKKFAYITTEGSEPTDAFYNALTRYVNIDFHDLANQTDVVQFTKELSEHAVIIVGIFPQTSPASIERLTGIFKNLPPTSEVILSDFGNELFLSTMSQFPTVLTGYMPTKQMKQIVAEVIFGGFKADGILPFTALALREGTSTVTEKINRLVYGFPEEAGMDSRVLSKIDSIAKQAIKKLATPGCQVLVARNGKVVYNKSFGFQTYENQSAVTDHTLYDLASLTKVSATLQAVMFMHEKGLIDINKKVSVYLPELKESNKKDITIIEMLTHQAGLVPFIPLWPQTMKDSIFLPHYYSRSRSASYPLQVASGLYTLPVMQDSIWSWIIKSKMGEKPPRTPYPYRYSDLGFMILQKLAERILNQPLNDFLQQNFYDPLGAQTTGFNPLEHFSKHTIAPTEQDNIYRKSLVVGTVHDERAAMMGGVSGHAGLFSNANDLAKLAQMLLQDGQYGGYQYYKPETVKLFSTKTFEKSRRGLGWDKPIQSDWSSPTSLMASPKTFGHTGFTGTCLWVDPEFNLIYIFLSNRVFPDRNNKLLNTNIRTRIQDVIYQSIFINCDSTVP